MTAIAIDRARFARITPAPQLRPLRVALAGCGHVGGGLLHLLGTHVEPLRRQLGRPVEVVSVLVRDIHRERPHSPPPGTLTDDLDAFLATDAEVVIEVIGGIEPARTIVERSLAAGRHVVTANKALLAQRGPALLRLAAESGATLHFEAAVGGAVPVVRVLRGQLAGHGVRAVRGVVNGTTNFVLGRLAAGESWDSAIAEAQRLGFAEADPSRDLDGRDAEDKLSVLAWLAFGIDPTHVPVHRVGLTPEIAGVVRAAAAGRETVRLVAELTLNGRRLSGSVRPVRLPLDHPLAQVRDEENVFEIESESAGVIRLSGRGAGGSPTASAVLADLIATARHTAAQD